ncbi:hypothetical protein QBC46DRAFT_110111 [Diplogelasinospora grovesii]|uniref:Uncharacterized protein n=1 Tax=Diplogelasinospora grovesii TaxID=303347 RepID=A0AAN6N8G9_9PEZI|nr:hypothetical protein QBC46DRAFT_110111 [Diplogelasinospora grovesii]
MYLFAQTGVMGWPLGGRGLVITYDGNACDELCFFFLYSGDYSLVHRPILVGGFILPHYHYSNGIACGASRTKVMHYILALAPFCFGLGWSESCALGNLDWDGQITVHLARSHHLFSVVFRILVWVIWLVNILTLVFYNHTRRA